ILVVDECRPKDRASIWNALKFRAGAMNLITIDHGPELSADDRMKILQCTILEREQIAQVIEGYIGKTRHGSRWAEWCSGSPRVAHAVGQNLKSNPDDILKPPATVPIWDRFVAGYGPLDSHQTEDALLLLRHIALFQKFGF